MALTWLDSFAGPDGELLQDHAPNLGTSYVSRFGACDLTEIQDNQLVCPPATCAGYSLNAYTPPADCSYRLAIIVDPEEGYWYFRQRFRAVDNNNNFALWCEVGFPDPTDVSIYVQKRLAGVNSTPATYAIVGGLSGSHSIGLNDTGVSIEGVVDGVTVFSFADADLAGNPMDHFELYNDSGLAVIGTELMIGDPPTPEVTMPSIVAVYVVMQMVRNMGTKFLLDAFSELLCDATPEAIDPIKLRLFKSDTTPDPTTEWGDLTEADFTGYLAQDLPDAACAGEIQGPALNEDGNWHMVIDQKIFAATGSTTSNLVYGFAITDADDNLLWVRRFEEGPYLMDENGDQLKITASIPLLPQGF